MEYLFIISSVFSALFFFLLLSKTKKEYEHWFLAVIFLLITINSLYVFQFYHNDDFYYVPFFSELNYAIPMLYGTLLWFYIKAITDAQYRFQAKELWHFAPFIIFFLILISPLIFNIELIKANHVGYPLIKIIINPLYLVAAFLHYRNYKNSIKQQLSFDVKAKMQWVNWILFGAVILWLVALIGFLYNSWTASELTLLYDYYVLSFLAIYLFTLAYLAFTRTDLFYNKIQELKPHKISAIDLIEQVDQNNSDDNDDGLLEKLKSIMGEQKPYLDPYLNINKLAEVTGIPQYKISKLLNNNLGLNFYDFINGYRIEDVKFKLKSGQADNYSILGIATDSGFNSKASFNRVFKKMTGQTPSQFLKSHS